ELAFKLMGFRSVGFIQESVSGTFGCGVSSALVLNFGAQTTNVCCVEDGQILYSGQTVLPYGGDQVTYLLHATLKLHSFPYAECDLRKNLDFELIDDLKTRLCTFDEDDIASQVYEIYVRNPGSATRVYPFKVFEERII